MAKEYQQQRGTVAYANADGTFAGSGSLNTPDAQQPAVAFDNTLTTQEPDQARALIDAGIMPVGMPIPSELALEIDLDGDNREALFFVHEGPGNATPIEGRRGDVRREAIGTVKGYITFDDETGNRFEKDDYVTRTQVILDDRGTAVRVEDEPEGVDQALDFMAVEVDYDGNHARAYEALRYLYDEGVVGEDDLMHAVGHLVYLHGEVEDGVDAGDWSTPTGQRALRRAFQSLTNALPVDFIRQFAYLEYGREYYETDRILGTPGENPFL